MSEVSVINVGTPVINVRGPVHIAREPVLIAGVPVRRIVVATIAMLWRCW